MGGKDGFDNCGQKERHAVDGDAVEEEDDGRGEHHRVEDAEPDSFPAELIHELSGDDSIGFEPCDGELLLRLCKPESRFRTVREGQEANYAEYRGCSAWEECVRHGIGVVQAATRHD